MHQYLLLLPDLNSEGLLVSPKRSLRIMQEPTSDTVDPDSLFDCIILSAWAWSSRLSPRGWKAERHLVPFIVPHPLSRAEERGRVCEGPSIPPLASPWVVLWHEPHTLREAGRWRLELSLLWWERKIRKKRVGNRNHISQNILTATNVEPKKFL